MVRKLGEGEIYVTSKKLKAHQLDTEKAQKIERVYVSSSHQNKKGCTQDVLIQAQSKHERYTHAYAVAIQDDAVKSKDKFNCNAGMTPTALYAKKKKNNLYQ